jgi:hypothetical protein
VQFTTGEKLSNMGAEGLYRRLCLDSETRTPS